VLLISLLTGNLLTQNSKNRILIKCLADKSLCKKLQRLNLTLRNPKT
jgi:hypothetical protein